MVQLIRINHFLSAVAGVRKDVLERAPQSNGQAATLGFLLLLTPSLSGITMGYAIYRVFGDHFGGWPSAIGGGALWTGIIFGIERSLLLGIDKTKHWKHVLRQIAVRVPLAFVIGVTVSLPLVLRVCQPVLDKELRDTMQHEITGEFASNAQRLGLADRITRADDLEREQDRQQERLQGEPNSQEYVGAKNEAQRADQKYESTTRANGQIIARLQNELDQMPPSSGENDPQERHAEQLRHRISQYRREIGRAAEDLSAAKRRLEAAKLNWIQQETNKLTDIQGRLAAARTDRNNTQASANRENSDSQKIISDLRSPNLVNEYTMLKRIEHNPSHPDAKTLFYFEWGLALVLFVLEITPVCIKALSRRNPIDDATIAAEAEDEERAVNASNLAIARIQKANEVAFTVEKRALEMWLDGRMEELQQQSRITVQDLQELRRETNSIAASAA
jgi:hypothetical protein